MKSLRSGENGTSRLTLGGAAGEIYFQETCRQAGPRAHEVPIFEEDKGMAYGVVTPNPKPWSVVTLPIGDENPIRRSEE